MAASATFALKAGLWVRRARFVIITPDTRHFRRSQAEIPLIGLSEFARPPLSAWKQELTKRASELFARGNKAPAVDDAQKVIDDLHRKIGQLQVERDFLAGQPAISRLLRGGR
jgi:hypothetical protein